MANYISVDVTGGATALQGIRLVPIDGITTIIATSTTETTINYKHVDIGGSGNELASFAFTHSTVGDDITAFVDLITNAIISAIGNPNRLVTIDITKTDPIGPFPVSAITVTLD